ncbi:MAG: GIY-YIG nuclease family protein [Candidatus Marinimicrobia bacterium]|nr:GIY-YIG nuclease family protein [Candidatus Neomarinimicrobiota bacterium]
MVYVYILKSRKDGKFYTGSTTDLKRRLREHNDGKSKSTRYRRPLILVYYEELSSIGQARVREKALKHPTLGKHKAVLINQFPKEKLSIFENLDD